jgi:phospholipid/cholesterol/gamma-HCH transport system substrate-binding protein
MSGGLRRAWRERLDTVPAEHRPRPLPAGIAAIAVTALLLMWGFTQKIPFIGGGGGQLVRAEVSSADAVNDRTPVRIGGVEVGRVDRIERGRTPSTSILVLRIKDDDVTVRRDAEAHIRWRTLLGNMFIELDPGTPTAPALGQRVIPLKDTGVQVDWNDFNSQFGAPTRLSQRHVIAELRRTLTAPREHGRTLHTLGPSLSVIGRGARALRGQQRGDLRRLVQTTATTVEALSRDRTALETVISGGDRTLAATAHRRTALGDAVDLAPPALAATTTTMRRLVTTLDQLDPLVAQLRPGARRLGPATRALRPALRQADRTLRDARPLLRVTAPALQALGAAGDQGSPLIDALEPTVARLTDELLPFLRRTDDGTKLKVYETIGPFFSAVDGSMSKFDASGHWLNFATAPGADSVLLPCDPGLQGDQLRRCTAAGDVLDAIFGGRRR